jgi:hypothetical protein
MLLSGFADRLEAMQTFAGAKLTEIGRWHRGTQAVWVANLDPVALDLEFLSAEEVKTGSGFWPLDLPVRLLETFAPRCGVTPGMTVWDGFAGRGTTGKACQLLGYRFVGVDISAERVTLAKRYLGLGLGNAP